MTALYTLLIILGIIIIFSLYNFFHQKKIINTLSEDEFRSGYRKAQLIDVREPQEFDNGHILGARNIPLTQMKQRLVEMRPDKPVYLYCQGTSRSARAANLLRKNGYQDLNVLKGGFRKWTGRVKN